jgi:peptidoglycan/LPS O-acetylase OafA/YrhL
MHIPVYLLTREIWFRLAPPGEAGFNGSYTLRFVVTAAALLIPLAALSYRYYEQPLRAYGGRLARRLQAEAPPPLSPKGADQSVKNLEHVG